MATNVVSNAIVLEVLNKHNYAKWSVWIKNYLLSQDLWDIVETESKPEENEAEFKNWRKKNATALHAIQISCGPVILYEIWEISSAKAVWDFLAKTHEPQSQEVIGPVLAEESDYAQYEGLFKAVVRGRLYDVKSFLDDHPDAVIEKRSSTGGTALHVVVSAGNIWLTQIESFNWLIQLTRLPQKRFNNFVKTVEELVQRMSVQDLEIQDSRSDTAFFLAAYGGSTQMAECMHEKNKNLVSIAGRNGLLPVVMASIKGHKDMVRYLYPLTPKEKLDPNTEGINGATLLSNCIVYKNFDVALHLLEKFPELAFARDYDGSSPVLILSQMPSAFRSGTRLLFCKWWIYYNCIRDPPDYDPGDIRIEIPKPHQGQTDGGNIVIRVFGQLRGLLLKLFGIKHVYDCLDQLYDTKLIHAQANKLRWKMVKEISSLSVPQLKEGLVYKAILQAAKNGIVEFIYAIDWSNPNLFLSSIDEDSRIVFMRAIIYRQENIFGQIKWLDATMVDALTSRVDRYGNNMLHLAGMSAPSISQGAALQMQKDLHWFQMVEDIMHPMFKEKLNDDGKTPHELLIENHTDLVKVGEEWKKETATSCTVVAALIVTITFAAAFTVPGDYDDKTGYPKFLEKRSFMIFIFFDAVSLFSSSTSLMIFLKILTSSLEESSLQTLSNKMVFGHATLLISIGTMATAFCAALYLMVGERWSWVYISVIILASVFVIVTHFILYKFPRSYSIPDKNDKPSATK